MATKRVMLANDSRLLREMLQRTINKADNLEVVQEVLNYEDLSPAIERFDPEWVILSLPSTDLAHGWMEACMAAYPSVRFILLSPDNSSIKMKWHASYEKELAKLSIKDFIHILEKDPQHIGPSTEIS